MMKFSSRGPAALFMIASALLGCAEETWSSRLCDRIEECRDFLSAPPDFGEEADETCRSLAENRVTFEGEACRAAYEARTDAESCEAFSAYRVPEACRSRNLFGRDGAE